MVTTAANFGDPRYLAGYDYGGVVKITYNGRLGTGVFAI